MHIINPRVLTVVLAGLVSTSVIADLNNYPVSDFSIERDSQLEIDSYYENLQRTIGSDPNMVPFEQDYVTVEDGSTIVDIARGNAIQDMDPVHLAVALYLNNRAAFRNDNVNMIIAGHELMLPTVEYLNEARSIFEKLLSEDRLDKISGLPVLKRPEPKSGNKMASIKGQGWQWKKFSEQRFAKPVALEKNDSYLYVNESSKVDSVSWEESRTTARVLQQPVLLGTPVIESKHDGEEYCPYCGLPMSVVRRGRLSPDVRQRALKQNVTATQANTAAVVNASRNVTVLGNDQLKSCSRSFISDELKSRKTSEFQLLTLSDGSKCIY